MAIGPLPALLKAVCVALEKMEALSTGSLIGTNEISLVNLNLDLFQKNTQWGVVVGQVLS